MNLVKIRVSTTSNKTADATGMVIRNNNSFRIVYFPKLVDNDKNPEDYEFDQLIENIAIMEK